MPSQLHICTVLTNPENQRAADTECHKLAHASFDAFAPCREMTLACIHSCEFACEIVQV